MVGRLASPRRASSRAAAAAAAAAAPAAEEGGKARSGLGGTRDAAGVAAEEVEAEARQARGGRLHGGDLAEGLRRPGGNLRVPVRLRVSILHHADAVGRRAPAMPGATGPAPRAAAPAAGVQVGADAPGVPRRGGGAVAVAVAAGVRVGGRVGLGRELVGRRGGSPELQVYRSSCPH